MSVNVQLTGDCGCCSSHVCTQYVTSCVIVVVVIIEFANCNSRLSLPNVGFAEPPMYCIHSSATFCVDGYSYIVSY